MCLYLFRLCPCCKQQRGLNNPTEAMFPVALCQANCVSIGIRFEMTQVCDLCVACLPVPCRAGWWRIPYYLVYSFHDFQLYQGPMRT